MAQQVQQPYQQQGQQQAQNQYQRQSGGGGGDQVPKGGSGGFSPEGLAAIFRQIGRAAKLFLSPESRIFLDEAATRDMLDTLTEGLALATEKGRLPEFAAHLEHEAGNLRQEMDQKAVLIIPQSGALHVMGSEAMLLLTQRIKDRWFPS